MRQYTRARPARWFPVAWRVAFTAAVVAMTSVGTPAWADDAGKDKKPDKPAASKTNCVNKRTEARFNGYGYDHWVHLKNECSETMVCSVKTNVNPEATTHTLAAGAEASVMTFMGSPAREFQAEVTCNPGAK